MDAVVVVAVLMHNKMIIERIRQSEKQRNIDTNPSVSAGSKTSDIETVTKDIGWTEKCCIDLDELVNEDGSCEAA